MEKEQNNLKESGWKEIVELLIVIEICKMENKNNMKYQEEWKLDLWKTKRMH